MNKQQPLTDFRRVYFRLHVSFGWWSLLCFLVVGIFLESLHGLKVRWYLEEAYASRRMLWMLGHVHGAVLGLVQIGFAMTLLVAGDISEKNCQWASACFRAASVMIPAGFLLGGLFLYEGEPGMGIYLTPIGALMLFAAVLLTVRALQADRAATGEQ